MPGSKSRAEFNLRIAGKLADALDAWKDRDGFQSRNALIEMILRRAVRQQHHRVRMAKFRQRRQAA